jgi:hypothetical protein
MQISDDSICFFHESAHWKCVPSMGKSEETKTNIVSVILCLESFSSFGCLFSLVLITEYRQEFMDLNNDSLQGFSIIDICADLYRMMYLL